MDSFICTTLKLVTELQDAELDKRQRKIFQLLDDPPEYPSKNCSWKFENKSVTKNPDIMLQFLEVFEPSSSFLIDQSQFKITELEKFITLPSTFLHNTKVSPANSSLKINK